MHYLAVPKKEVEKAGLGMRQVLPEYGSLKFPFAPMPPNGLDNDMKWGSANISEPIAVITTPVPIQRGM